MNPKYYVVKKDSGFVTTDFENYENVAEDIEAAEPVTAEEILKRVAGVDISLVTDSDPNVWEVEHMHGKDLTLQELQDIK